MLKKFFILLASFTFLLFIPGLFFGEELTILHTNDTHSHLYSFGPNDSYGGIDRMSALIKSLKRRNENVLTLNSGDVFVGTFAFNKYLGYPELKIMEGLYDAMCLGNHEFDLGIDVLTGILSGYIPGETPVTLPVLCANIDWTKLGENHSLRNFVKPYLIMTIGTLKIGLIGVVENNAYDYSPKVLEVLTDPIQAAGEWAYYLKNNDNEKCDIVICLSHLGTMAEVMGLSQVSSIDIIIGGHSHDALFEPIVKDGKIIVQAGEFGMYLGELKVDVINGTVALKNYKLHPINRMVRKDPTSVKVHGLPINPNGLYWVALNEQLVKFLSNMGLVPFYEIDTGLFEYNLVRDFAHELKFLRNRSEGRIIDTALLKNGGLWIRMLDFGHE